MCERLLTNPLIEEYEIEVAQRATSIGQAMPEAEHEDQDAGPEAPRRIPL
jgi:hypothetical protein